MTEKSPFCVDVPEGQSVVEVRFYGNPAVTLESDATRGVTVSFPRNPSPPSVVIGNLVRVRLADTTVVESDSDDDASEESITCGYGVVHRVFKTEVVVIWFYAYSEFRRPYPKGFGTKVNLQTLSTMVSENISKEAIEVIKEVPDMSDCVFCPCDNVLKGDAALIMRYYETVAIIHLKMKETSWSYVEAVDWAITTKQGMFAIIGTIKPSQMAATIGLFGASGRVHLPHEIGPEIGKIGEFSLSAW